MTAHLSRWVTAAEAQRPEPITLPLLTQQLATPADAVYLTRELAALIDAFTRRDSDLDRPLLGALIDLQAGVRQHRRELDRWHDRQAAEFTARLEADE